MSGLDELTVIRQFGELGVELERGSALLDRVVDVGVARGLAAGDLANEWVAFAAQRDCQLAEEGLDQWERHLSSSRRKTPSSRRHAPKQPAAAPRVMYNTENIDSVLYGDDGSGEEDMLAAYCTPDEHKKLRGQKRGAVELTSPPPSTKSRHTHNGATPVAPVTTNGDTSFTVSTPAAKFIDRQNQGSVVCSLNEGAFPLERQEGEVAVGWYDRDTALTGPYQYMFQKVSDKASALIERIVELGGSICQHYGLSEPAPLSQPSLEPTVYVGQVVCEGEGHLNAQSCLLEGPTWTHRRRTGCAVKLDLPDSATCSLFPGQVIAVEGILNNHGRLTPSRLHDDGLFPPLPVRGRSRVGGVSLLVAAGPFSTADSLDMAPLAALLGAVEKERPGLLVLLGPFLDTTHPLVQDCNLPGDMTFVEFFDKHLLRPILKTARKSNTKLVLVPSQKDVHHPLTVYPQPPFPRLESDRLLLPASDPATLSVNGLCVGVTSTDVLFHLSARTMFRGPSGDRMARLAGHLLRQQCYYPLIPPFKREDHTRSSGESDQSDRLTESSEINLDFLCAFHRRHALMPARPDLLLLPSDLKPFAKRLDGCVCVNPGRLTKKAGGGTYAKIVVPDLPATQGDFSSDIGVQIVHI